MRLEQMRDKWVPDVTAQLLQLSADVQLSECIQTRTSELDTSW
jgi:hypothetical protein